MEHRQCDVKKIIRENKDKINYNINSEEERIIKDLKKLYILSLKSYKKLIEGLDIESPLDIYLIFSYLLRNGYLSLNKNFKRTDDNTVDIIIKENIPGINIMCGEGVCRHASSLFTDIFNTINLNSKMVNGYLSEKGIRKTFYWRLKNYLETTNAFGIEETFRLPYIEAIANHTFLTVEKNGIKYYLDPINDAILMPKEDETGVLKASRKYEVLVNKKIIKDSDFKELEEYNKKRIKTKEFFLNNTDLFDNIHSINNIIYEEASIRVRKLDKERIY